MFERILVPLDGSQLAEGVLPHAVTVARAIGGQLTVVHVLEPQQPAGGEGVVDPLDWHLRKAEATHYLATVAGQLADLDLGLETVLLEGQAADQIVDYVNKHGVDLLVLSSHGRGGLSRWNVSSVVQKIIFLANTSVLLVRAYQQTEQPIGGLQYTQILAPLDGSRRAEVVLPVVMTLSKPVGSEPWLVTAVTRPEMPRHAPPAPEDVALADRLVSRNLEASESYLAQLAERWPGVQARTLVGESVSAMLQEFVSEEGVDLVVFCAHGYSGRRRHPYGSVVTNFIVYGTTPLLIVQDIPQEEIAPTKAETVAGRTGKSDGGKGGRTVVHARTTE